jgi:hypothetical protein
LLFPNATTQSGKAFATKRFLHQRI